MHAYRFVDVNKPHTHSTIIVVCTCLLTNDAKSGKKERQKKVYHSHTSRHSKRAFTTSTCPVAAAMYPGVVAVMVFALLTSALLSSSTFTTSTWPLSASRETKSCGRCGQCGLRRRLANSRRAICKRGQQRQRHHRGSGCKGQH